MVDEIVEAKKGIIIDANPESGEVAVGVDIDGDNKPDFTFKTIIKDKRFWLVVGGIIAIILVVKGMGY
jgi:hypothetical protein